MDTFPGLLATAGLAITASALLFASWSDVRRFMIPNRASIAIAAAYLLALPVMPLQQWITGVVVALFAFAFGAFLFARGWVGGGDVKLAGATTLWAGPALLADFVTMVSLAGAAMAMLMLVLPARRSARAEGGASALALRLNQPMAFGVPLAVGGLWVVALRLASLA